MPRATVKSKPVAKKATGFVGRRFTSFQARRPAQPPMSVGGELKFHDLDIDDAVVAVNGTIAQDSCNIIAGGTTESTRIGRKSVIRKIGWRYEIVLPNAQNMTSVLDTIRVILYWDKQANGATATVTGILESDDFQSFNNLSNKNRFVILMDRTHELNAQAGGGNGTANDIAGIQKNFNFFKTCEIPIEFDSTTGALTEQRSNNIGVLLLGKQGFLGFFSKMRLRFTDN